MTSNFWTFRYVIQVVHSFTVACKHCKNKESHSTVQTLEWSQTVQSVLELFLSFLQLLVFVNNSDIRSIVSINYKLLYVIDIMRKYVSKENKYQNTMT